MSDTKLFQAAQYFRDKGLSIIPCKLFFDEKGKCKKPPHLPPKTGWKEFQKKQVSMLDLMKWKDRFPDKNGHGIGIITGEVSNLLVVDIDSQETYNAIEHFLQGVQTVNVKTPGGWHFYFKYREGFGNNVGIDPDSGLDLRAEGGYVVAPPSLYPDGKRYMFPKGGYYTGPESVAPMPEALYQHLIQLIIKKKGNRPKGDHGGAREGSGRKSKAHWFHDLMLNGVKSGGRTSAMVEAEGYMLGRKMPRELIETVITMFNNSLGEDSLTDHELREEVIPAIDRIAGDTVERVVKHLNKKISLVELDSGDRVISERFTNFKGIEKIRFSKVMAVRESYIEREVMINKKPECIFDIWRTHKEKRKHKGVIFNPAATPWESGDFINLWKGFQMEPKKGDWSLFRNHIETIITKEHHEWVIQWMANIIQNPGGKRPGTVIVLRGDQGTGKGMFANIFGSLIGKMEYFFSVSKIGDLTGRFNEDLKTALLLFIDEATWGGDKETAGILKSLVTEPTRRVEPKGINAFHIDNYLSLIIASNNRWVVPGGSNERRFCVLDVPNDKQQDSDYFGAILDEMYEQGGLEAMFYDLLRVEIDFDFIRTIPKTAGTADQITKGLDLDEQFWYERLTIGTLVDRHDYWKTLSVNETLYQQYTEYCTQKHREIQMAGRQQWGSFMNRVVPGLKKKQGYDAESGNRYPCRILPELHRCREYFTKKYGVGEWPDVNEPDNITTKMRADDIPGPHYRQNY